jgi:hypothetical protein
MQRGGHAALDAAADHTAQQPGDGLQHDHVEIQRAPVCGGIPPEASGPQARIVAGLLTEREDEQGRLAAGRFRQLHWLIRQALSADGGQDRAVS